jgi:serine O-acetyltransferase
VDILNKIKKDFLAVKNRDPAFKNNIELLYAYPGVWAIVWYRIANAIYKKGFKNNIFNKKKRF